MAIAFRAAGTGVSADSGNLASVGLPAGLANGDLLLCVTSQNDNVSCTMPAGYARIVAQNNGTAGRQEVWWKVAASESAPTVTHAAGSTSRAQLLAFSGAGNIGVVGTPGTGTTSGTETANGITPTDGNSGIVFVATSTSANTDGGGANNWASYSGTNPTFTECAGTDAAAAELTHEATLAAAFGLSGNGAATGNRTVALSAMSSGALAWVATLLELTPAVSATQTIPPVHLPFMR